jgi:antitoxin component of MazEF toxin-antitoxin module
MNIITKLRQISKSSIGFTVPSQIVKNLEIEKGTYKIEVEKENDIIVIRLENLF